jgi:hypothetical protein
MEDIETITKGFLDYKEPVTVTPRAIFMFLLGGSMNSQGLSLDKMDEELRVVAKGSNLAEKDRPAYVEYLKLEAQKLTDRLKKEHDLEGHELLLLEQILLGLTQVTLIESDVEYAVRIVQDGRIGYVGPGSEIVRVTEKVFNIVLNLFNRKLPISPGLDIGVSSEEIFRSSAAIRVNSIVSKIDGRKTEKVIEAVPIYRIPASLEEWNRYVGEL